MSTVLRSIGAMIAICVAACVQLASPAAAQPQEARFALVIGNDGYDKPVPTAANDAGLIADTLRSASFDVSGARNLDADSLRAAIKEFGDKVKAAAPGAVAFVYFAGYGVQFEGENYLVPVGAAISQPADIPNEAVKLSEIDAALDGAQTKARIIVLAGAHSAPFADGGQQLAGGLALVEPDEGELIAFNAAPGSVAPLEEGPYSAFASALAEMIRTGGLDLNDVFERVRLRVNETTKGVVVPWDASHVTASFLFFELAPDAPRPAAGATASLAQRPIKDFSAEDAYAAALARDTLPSYVEYLQVFPKSPYAKRVQAIVAARREALTWRRSVNVNTPQAYWSYLRRYPRGPHAWDAQRRLQELAAALQPPPDFAAIDYGDLPPPPPAEVVYVERGPVIVFDEPDFAPPPPPPVAFLPPPPRWWEPPPPPPPAFAPYFLPIPKPFARPVYLVEPRYVVPPPPPPLYVQVRVGERAGARPIAAATAPPLPRAVAERLARHGIVAKAPPAPLPGRRQVSFGQSLPGVPSVAHVTLPVRPAKGAPTSGVGAGEPAPSPKPPAGALPSGAALPKTGPSTFRPMTPAGKTPGAAAPAAEAAPTPTGPKEEQRRGESERKGATAPERKPAGSQALPEPAPTGPESRKPGAAERKAAPERGRPSTQANPEPNASPTEPAKPQGPDRKAGADRKGKAAPERGRPSATQATPEPEAAPPESPKPGAADRKPGPDRKAAPERGRPVPPKATSEPDTGAAESRPTGAERKAAPRELKAAPERRPAITSGEALPGPKPERLAPVRPAAPEIRAAPNGAGPAPKPEAAPRPAAGAQRLPCGRPGQPACPH